MKSFLKRSTFFTAVFLALLTLLPWSVASAQQVLEQQRNRPTAVQTLVGTVDGKAEDDGYITISGTNYDFDSEITEVYLRNNLVRSGIIDEGMAVRISLDAQGTMIRIDILGPFNQLRLLDQN
ncbi:MAG: hypothetical protein PsegKO_09690 [Pseudohongiellaceae bacterium]|jgi:hypothetical protein